MADQTYTWIDQMVARDIAGHTMARLGVENDRVVMVTADVMGSSRTAQCMKDFPERSFNLGIAEQELVSFSAGLAKEGLIPYCFSFGSLLSMRALEQIRSDVCYSNLPVRFIGNNAGYSAGPMGATHCGLEDVGIMCSLGNMTVVEPGDPLQVAKILEASLSWDGPLYVRMGREAQTAVYAEDYKYEIGKAITVLDGGDGAFICSGSLVHSALEVAKKMKEDLGLDIRVIDMHTIKPIDRDAVISAVKTGRIVCAQDGNIQNGLGYQVAAVIAETGVSCRFKMLGCPDYFVPLATSDYLYHKNGYDVDGLYKNMKELL